MTNKDVVSRFFEVSNELQAGKGIVSELDQLFRPEFVQHIAQYPPITLAGFKDMASASNDAFSDAHITVKELVEENDKVSAYVVWQGTHTGEIWGIPATQKVISTEAMHLFRLVDGKVAEMWSVSDASGMKQQLTASE